MLKSMELARISRQRASDEVYLTLRQSILSHLFEPGERLQVDEIAEKLGVSLTPVRHAIQQLATEGLIEIRPRSGTFVAQLSVRDIEETFDLRMALECLAAEKLIQYITKKDVAEFRKLLVELAQPIDSDDDHRRHQQDNRRFHQMLIDGAGNHRLSETYAELNAHLQIVRAHSRQTGWAKRLKIEQEEHEEIVHALESKNLPRLQKAIRNHIQRSCRSLVEGLKDS